MDLLARLDGVSRTLLERFFQKVTLFVAFATFVSVLRTHGLGLAGVLLQTQCLVGAGLSIMIAVYCRQHINSPTLTHWDEAIAFSGIGMLSHIATSTI